MPIKRYTRKEIIELLCLVEIETGHGHTTLIVVTAQRSLPLVVQILNLT